MHEKRQKGKDYEKRPMDFESKKAFEKGSVHPGDSVDVYQ